MKKMLLFFSILFLIGSAYSQTIEAILEIQWNKDEGFKTEVTRTGIYGVRGFALMSENRVAFYADRESKMKIYSLENNDYLYDFDLSYTVNNFTFDMDNNIFFCSDYNGNVVVHYADGVVKEKIAISPKIKTIINLSAQKNSLYAEFKEYTYTIIREGNILSPARQVNHKVKGSLINNGDYVYVDTEFPNKINVFITNKEIDFEIVFPENEKTYGITPIYKDGDYYYFIQVFYVEKYNDIERKLIGVDTNGQIRNRINIPKIRFTVLDDEFKAHNNLIYHLLTTPDHASLMKINPGLMLKSSSPSNYPKKYDYQFHYNDSIQKLYDGVKR